MSNHRVVSHEDWLVARKAFVQKEREFLQARDELSRLRRELPWERVEKPYLFDTPSGQKTLSDLFDGRSQLAVYHLMYGPHMELPCKSCSFWADSFDHIGPHLAARDVTFLAVSRGPLDRLLAFKKRLGWSFDWVSAAPSDFNYDLQATLDPERGAQTYNFEPTTDKGERPGISVFYRDERGAVFHTYSTYARGIDSMNAAYQYLDLTPLGRHEDGLPHTMSWVMHRDRYGKTP